MNARYRIAVPSKAAVTIEAGEAALIQQIHLAADPEEVVGRLAGLIT